jgi:hypothetical protein
MSYLRIEFELHKRRKRASTGANEKTPGSPQPSSFRID